MEWTVKSFLQAIEDGEIGRKSQHSSYYIQDFDTCRVLVRKNKRINEIIVGPEAVILLNGLVIWDMWSSNRNEIKVRYIMDFRDVPDVCDLGVIDRNFYSNGREEIPIALLDSKGKRFLVDVIPGIPNQCSIDEYLMDYGSQDTRPVKFGIHLCEGSPESIPEARQESVEPIREGTTAIGGFWVTPRPDFSYEWDEEIKRKILYKPHPIEFGIPFEEWGDYDLEKKYPEYGKAATKYHNFLTELQKKHGQQYQVNSKPTPGQSFSRYENYHRGTVTLGSKALNCGDTWHYIRKW